MSIKLKLGNEIGSISPRVKHNGAIKTPLSVWAKKGGVFGKVWDAFAVKSITVQNITGTIEGGGTRDLNNYVTITPANAKDKTLTWSMEWISGDQSVVSLSSSGIVTYENTNAGQVKFRVIATASNGVTGSAVVSCYVYHGISG